MSSFMNKIKARIGGHKKETTSNEQEAQQSQQAQQAQGAPQQGEQQPASSGEATESNNDHEGCLKVYNDARAAKGCTPLQWDDGLAHDAESYARTLAEKDKMEHAGVEDQGENLYMSTGDATFDQAVQSWLDEEKAYHGEKIGEGNFAQWGHFSQCLWHSTTHVGMGKARASNGATYIVARYTPQGNMAGEKPF